jgi:hypothetical protein
VLCKTLGNSLLNDSISNPWLLFGGASKGSAMEIQCELLSFGIPMDHFPLDDDYKLLGLKDFFERRSNIENERRIEQGSRILAPCKLDILLGRGKPMQEWLGNLQLATTLATYADLHNSTAMNRRGAKNDLCDEIVRLLKESGGRFLKREEGALEWIEVDDTMAREKVSHGFRNQRLSLSKTTLGQTRKAGSEMGGSRIVPVESLSAVNHPNIDGGSKRPRKMDALHDEEKTVSKLSILNQLAMWDQSWLEV